MRKRDFCRIISCESPVWGIDGVTFADYGSAKVTFFDCIRDFCRWELLDLLTED